jgi:hypothetical protein
VGSDPFGKLPTAKEKGSMKTIAVNAGHESLQKRKSLIPAMLVLILLAGFLAFRAGSIPGFGVTTPGITTISQSVLEEQYGLRVNLVAVTAAGGMVDVRLKIVDGEKAKQLLKDPTHFPSLWIAAGDVTLVVPEENRTQEISFENDGNLFMMFPNSAGIVKPGTPVVVRFGEIQVESIPSK